MLRLRSLTKNYGCCLAVDKVDLDIPAGQMVGVIGRSGAGKSTLLRLVNRLADPTGGDILHGDTRVSALRGQALRRWRADCAMIFQQFNLVGRLNVITNVLVGRLGRRRSLGSLFKFFDSRERGMAVTALRRLEMDHLALQRAESLSGGQQQRVAIARAMVQEPKIILADEPIASLDPKSAAQVMEALKAINAEQGLTVICNLHHLHTAKAFCHRIVGLAQGRVVFDGPAEQLDLAALREVYGPGQGMEELSAMLDQPELPAQAYQPMPAVC
jgi:phosphonate transport system ATP-binding protein